MFDQLSYDIDRIMLKICADSGEKVVAVTYAATTVSRCIASKKKVDKFNRILNNIHGYLPVSDNRSCSFRYRWIVETAHPWTFFIMRHDIMQLDYDFRVIVIEKSTLEIKGIHNSNMTK